MRNMMDKQFDINVPSVQEVENLMARKLTSTPPREEFKYELRQWLTAFGAISGAILAGVTTGFSAILIPQLESTTDKFINSTDTSFFDDFNRITIQTTTQKSWLGFSGALLLAPGCWMSGLLIEKLGRRMTHLVTSPLYLTAWIIIAFCPSFNTLIIGRLFSGLFMGILAPACPVYIAEATNPRLRGILLGFISVAASIGNLFAHATGTWMHWRLASLWCGSFNIVCFIFCFIFPESPTWLLKKGKIESASSAWRFLRGLDSSKEFEALRAAHSPGSISELKIDNINWREIVSSRSFLKPLGIVFLLFFTAQCSGVNSITYYSVDIFKKVADPNKAFMWTLIIDVVKVVICGLTCWLIKRVSNRGLALVSGSGTALVLFSLVGVQYYDVGNPWLPVVLLILYNITCFIGLIPLSWMMCGELFPMAYKGLGTGLSSGFGFLCLFVVVLSAPYMFDFFLTHGTFFIYGCVATVGTCLLFLYLPETRGKTLLEIERSFDKRKCDFVKIKSSQETNDVV